MANPPSIQDLPWRRNLAFATIGVVMAGAAFNLVNPFLPFFLDELGLEKDLALWSGLMLAAPAFTYALMAPVWGTLADRYGKRVMLLRSGFGIAATYILMGFSRDHWQFLVFRTANGLLSGFIPASLMLVASNTPAPDLGFALGVIQTASSVGAIIGPLLGGLAARLLGIRIAFFFGAGLLAAASLLSYLGTQEVIVLQEGDPGILGGLRASMSRRDLAALFLVMFGAQTALMVVQPTLPLFIQDLTTGLGGREVALAAGLVFSLTGLSTALGAPLIGRIDRVDHRRVLGAGLAVSALLSCLQGFAGRIALLGAERFVFGFANAAILVAGNVLIARSAPEHQRGQVFGVLNAVSSIGSILGPILGGYAAGRLGVPSSFFLSGLLFAAALPLALPVRGRGMAETSRPGPQV